MRILTPTTLEQALELLATAEQPITPIAGGTDLLVAWHNQIKDGLNLLDLSPLGKQLQPFRLTDDHLELGALTSFWDVIQSGGRGPGIPTLKHSRSRGRCGPDSDERGTWAGNIGNGSPAADGVPVLMAYDATVVLQSREDSSEVPLDRYYTGYKQTVRRPDQLIVAICVPRRVRELEWFYKVGTRRAQAISKVGVAVVKDAHGWRVVANSLAPMVRRCRTLEKALNDGRTFQDVKQIRDLLDHDIAPIDDIRSTAAYRATVLSRLLYYWLAENT